MFKKIGDAIYRMPWWGLLLGGLLILLALILFSLPVHVLRLADSGSTPAERSAIHREINLAFGDRALDIAEGVVGGMKSRTHDPERQRELDRALAEMSRARKELSDAHTGIGGPAGEVAASAADGAIETATDAAQSALDSAIEARETLQEARDEAIEKLRSKGIDTAATARSFNELIKSARENETTARESLAAISALGKGAPPATKATLQPSATPGTPGTPNTPAPSPKKHRAAAPPATDPGRSEPATGEGKPMIEIHVPAAASSVALAPEVRTDIREKVADDVWRIGVGSALILLFIPLFVVLMFAKYFIGRSRRALAFAEEKKQEAKVSDVSRQITEARLQALQAQVEPHFLYNTLANVQALTEADPPAANAMVGHLIQYLRAALPKMRENTSTVGQEVELVTAYLNILKMRMGTRLDFGIDVPAELMNRPFPPLMLPSLVENAIKHGLEPLREGGRIDVVVRRLDPGGERIQVQVRDTGKGFSDAPMQAGGGIGLSNLRERLAGLYGEQAKFTLESNVPRGVIATIDMPASGPSLQAGPAAPGATAAPQPAPEPPATGWRRAWQATSKTHSVWARIVSRLFFGLMTLLGIAFLLALLGLYTGAMHPINIGGWEPKGMESKALGSVVLLAAFAAAALAVVVVVAVFYGLGFVFAGLLVVVPAALLIGLFPVLAPFILIGLAIYWFWWRKRRSARNPKPAAQAAPAAPDPAGQAPNRP